MPGGSGSMPSFENAFTVQIAESSGHTTYVGHDFMGLIPSMEFCSHFL